MHSRDRTRARVKLHKDYNTWGWEIEGWALYDANGDILQHSFVLHRPSIIV